MKYLKISNKGLLEPEALSLVGASTKRGDDSTIGQFGSGNKFALAFLLRNDFELSVYSGQRQIELSVNERSFRDNSFNVISVDGNPTSITTEMGKDWKLWEALRELYCNALDEGEHEMELTNKIEPKEGYTHFYIRTDKAIREFVTNFAYYFSEGKEVVFESEVGKILEKEIDQEEACIYRKGVRCYDTSKKSAYDYDFNDIAINESRSVRHSWRIPEKIWALVKQCDNKEVILNILKASSDEEYLESEMADGISSLAASKMSEHFKETVRATRMAPKEYAGMLPEEEQHNHLLIPNRIFKKVETYLDENATHKRFNKSSDGVYQQVSMKPLWEQTLREALDFLSEVGYEIPYEVIPVQFHRKSVMGAARPSKKEILISDTCFEKGVNELVNTMIEEYIHIKHGVSDETRAMQTAIITEFVTYMKNKNAYSI